MHACTHTHTFSQSLGQIREQQAEKDTICFRQRYATTPRLNTSQRSSKPWAKMADMDLGFTRDDIHRLSLDHLRAPRNHGKHILGQIPNCMTSYGDNIRAAARLLLFPSMQSITCTAGVALSESFMCHIIQRRNWECQEKPRRE